MSHQIWLIQVLFRWLQILFSLVSFCMAQWGNAVRTGVADGVYWLYVISQSPGFGPRLDIAAIALSIPDPIHIRLARVILSRKPARKSASPPVTPRLSKNSYKSSSELWRLIASLKAHSIITMTLVLDLREKFSTLSCARFIGTMANSKYRNQKIKSHFLE